MKVSRENIAERITSLHELGFSGVLKTRAERPCKKKALNGGDFFGGPFHGIWQELHTGISAISKNKGEDDQ